MEKIFSNEEVIGYVNNIISKLLVGASVESYGILHQMRFIDFRNPQGDIRIIIDSELEIFPEINIEGLTIEQKDLLILNQVNLKQIKKVECSVFADIVFTYTDETVLKISGTPIDETTEEPWQLTNQKEINDNNYILIIALREGGYTVWGNLSE